MKQNFRAYLSITQISNLWNRVRTSFWFLPSALACAAIIVSFLLVRVDSWLDDQMIKHFKQLFSFGPEGARTILSIIASSMITVASLIFSITMLTLQLASTQFGPRLLRNFMRDRNNQIVLGTFISTFLYCLLVLRTVHGGEKSGFVPHIAVVFGIFLAVVSVAVLIHFIHHITKSIQIETLLAQLAAEMRSTVDRLYPMQMGEEPPQCANETALQLSPDDFKNNARPINARKSGYVQRVDVEALMQLATKHDLVVRIEAQPGDFVMDDEILFTAGPREHVLDEITDELRGTLVVGTDRTPEQDIRFAIRRIVEIAQRSLSPGINDPTTALYCIDRLREGLGCMASRSIPAATRFDEKKHLRIITRVTTLDTLACSAFSAIARYGISDVDVMTHLLAAMKMVAHLATPEKSKAIMELHEKIRHESQDRIMSAFDQETLQITIKNGKESF